MFSFPKYKESSVSLCTSPKPNNITCGAKSTQLPNLNCWKKEGISLLDTIKGNTSNRL